MELDYLQALMGGTLAEEPTSEYRDIWVIAETRQGKLAAITRELLGGGRDLATTLGARVACVLLGDGVSSLAGEAIACGSDSVYVLDDPLLADYRTETYVGPLAALIGEKKPEIVLLGATARGRDLAPRLATRLNTGLLSECVSLSLDETERLLLGTRGTYGGIWLTTVACPTARPQMATVRPGCLRLPPPDSSREGTVEQVEVSLSQADVVSMIEAAEAPPIAVPLTEARVVVCGGRGVGGAEGFELLEELADAAGGVVAASRSAVELGWASRDCMVDVAGNQVRPDLYIAVGISGVFPHRIATRGVRCLAAINKDPHAPILRRADYGIIGDWRQVVPELITAIREARRQ